MARTFAFIRSQRRKFIVAVFVGPRDERSCAYMLAFLQEDLFLHGSSGPCRRQHRGGLSDSITPEIIRRLTLDLDAREAASFVAGHNQVCLTRRKCNEVRDCQKLCALYAVSLPDGLMFQQLAF